MPSKYRKKLENKRKGHAKNKATEKAQKHKWYTHNKDVHIKRFKQRVKENATTKLKNKLTVKNRLATSPMYRAKNIDRAKYSQKMRLKTNEKYRIKKQMQAKTNNQLRLKRNERCRQQQLQWSNRSMKKWLENTECQELNRQRSRIRYLKVRQTEKYNAQHRKTVRNSRIADDLELTPDMRRKLRKQRTNVRPLCRPTNSRVQLTEQQKYWLRRSRLLAELRRRTQRQQKQQKMALKSDMSAFDIQMLFNKAEQQIKTTTIKIKQLHTTVANKAHDCLQYIPEDLHPTEADITTAFEGVRLHSAFSEPYFWQQSSRPVPATLVIPVDSDGKAHVFNPLPDATQDNQKVPKKWQCNNEVCAITRSQLHGTAKFLYRLAHAPLGHLPEFYNKLDNCGNEWRTDNLGHSLHCSSHTQCSSLFYPARTLSCHFPYLRSIIRRIYDARRLSKCINIVQQAMSDGSYQELEEAIKLLHDTTNTVCGTNDATSDADEEQQTSAVPIKEEYILEQFGKSLRQVADQRDSYNTDCCDVCEQLRSDLHTIQSYEYTKGFDSDKMQEMIELLYQNKTQHEDIEQFLENTKICKYCADKLRNNKEIARSIFNDLTVIPTPPCIADLNLFEKALIKFCMNCITIIRLGQITTKARPKSELTSALKGRIVYLPVDVSANAKFHPNKVLNIDSLVVLVGGQPTHTGKIWTSLVDLSKVHTALGWLRENNKLYKDVPSHTIQELKDILHEKLNTTQSELNDPTNNDETASDTGLLNHLDDAAKSFLYENFTIQPLSSDIPADALADYQLKKVSGQGMDIFDSELDVKAFPELFPTGQYGIKDTTRTAKISTSDFIRSRLLNKNPKFRLNINYLFHCFQIQEVSNMCHSVGHMLRTVTNNSMSAKAFHERLQKKDGELNSNMFTMMANIRGSKEYFARLGMELKWMIKKLGPPTLFVTCSTAEWFSQPFISYLRTVNSCVQGINEMTPGELCAMDPVNVSIHFHQKWNAIFSKLICSKQQPLFGEVQDFFWRIEYQARGAPHVHLVLWIKDAPILGRNSTEEVKQYIQKIVTCSKPSENDSPTLNSLVSQFQTHKCNTYCTKTYKKGAKYYKKCRFGFPRPATPALIVHDVIDCLAVSKNKQPRKRLYNLPRNKTEAFINDYNPALLLANQANVDVQYIGHLGSRLQYYITEYITKYERSEQDNMWHEIFSSTKSLGSNAISFALKSVKSRQVGANEAADRLLGHKLFSKSRQLRYADLEPANKVKRLLRNANEISHTLEENPESQDIFHIHWVQDVYPDRPDELESSSLHNFLSWYEKEKLTAGSTKPLQLKYHPFHLRRRRSVPYIVTHKLVNINQSDEHKELYYYYLLKLFKPWRNEQELSVPGCTYEELYKRESTKFPEMVKYHVDNTKLAVQEEEIENTVKERAKEIQTAGNNNEPEDEQSAFVGCQFDHVHEAMQDVITAQSLAIRRDQSVSEDYTSLNVDQKRVVDKVVSTIFDTEIPIRMIVSGEGGTGKSKVIDVLQRMISVRCGSNCVSVVVTAPTGLAAHNVGGSTIHRVLCLPVEHGKPADYRKLSQDQLKTIRTTLQSLKLIIVDEVSMVSSLTLLFAHLRLTEIMSSDDYFGGISVLFFADFLQLPPVKGNQPFMPVTQLEAKQRLGSVASIDLWHAFQYDELTINMRQNGDTEYATLLSNVRVGKISEQHYKLLTDRLIAPGGRASTEQVCNLYSDLLAKGCLPIILLPRTVLCDEINTAMLRRISNNIRTIDAKDTLETIVDKKLMPKILKAYRKIQQDTTRTAGLEKSMQLCIGARVMLKRNKDIDAGLVNGSIGTVHDFKFSDVDNGSEVNAVSVLFPNNENPVSIIRETCSFEVLKGVYYTRKQFPLMLAFAITIHKSQGLSLSSVIVDAGAGAFGCGMVYVALSRVTSLQGLHLIDLDKSRIQCDEQAVKEYNRLRELYTPHLGAINSNLTANSTSDTAARNIRKRSWNQAKTEQNGLSDKAVSRNPSNIRKRKYIPKTQYHRNGCDEVVPTEENPDVYLDENIFRHCNIQSIGNEFQESVRTELNLMHMEEQNPVEVGPVQESLSNFLQKQIYNIAQRHAHVTIHTVKGDGNCLFRALSLAVTGTQQQHDIIRSYIVNHMLHVNLRVPMERLFIGRDTTYDKHLQAMQKTGEWGTDIEIIAAAHLFNCSIVCVTRLNRTSRLWLQHFSPHFAVDQVCTSLCQHETIYVVNYSGSHYDLARVLLKDSNTMH